MSDDAGARSLTLDSTLPGVRIGAIEAAPVCIAPAADPLRGEIAAVVAELRERLAGRAPAEIEELAPARRLYRTFGIDPTRTRPSSEALLRRVLRGRPLPRILNAVDLCNLLALRFLLPLGLYDRARIEPPVRLREGRAGESYPGIRKETVGVTGRPVLADRRGAFGNPTSDSLRTSVRESTTRLWLVIFAPASLPGERLAERTDQAAEALRRHLGAPGAEPRCVVTLVEPASQ